jgi:lysophospholipase L1-like esterase
MQSNIPRALIVGHSFVKRLQRDLHRKFDARANINFKLNHSVKVTLHGIGGQTVTQLHQELERIVAQDRGDSQPSIIVIEIGTNDLTHRSPEVVVDELSQMIDFLVKRDIVRAVAICNVIPRRRRGSGLPDEEFNKKAATFNKMLIPLFEDCKTVFLWQHIELSSLSRPVLLPDGVHLNPRGQYNLYRSYRGAILKGLSLLRLYV